MNLFNVSKMVNEKNLYEVLKMKDDPAKLKKIIEDSKRVLLNNYQFRVFNVPDDFANSSYIITANHLTDSDAPLIMSFYDDIMSHAKDSYSKIFVFAKENCFNGVSIPKELAPVLESENIFPVNRNSVTGSLATLKTAIKWYNEGEKPKHFLIFAQGTIYDINLEKVEDIEKGTFWLAKQLNIPVLPAFLEQAVEGEENYMVFGEPFMIPTSCRDFDIYKKLWIDSVIKAQNDMEKLSGRPAREVILDDSHKIRKRIKGI